jgi:hypothetical protein
MLAALLHDFDHLALEDVPIPEPGLGEVAVRIRTNRSFWRLGLCSTPPPVEQYIAGASAERSVCPYPCGRRWSWSFVPRMVQSGIERSYLSSDIRLHDRPVGAQLAPAGDLEFLGQRVHSLVESNN